MQRRLDHIQGLQKWMIPWKQPVYDCDHFFFFLFFNAGRFCKYLKLTFQFPTSSCLRGSGFSRPVLICCYHQAFKVSIMLSLTLPGRKLSWIHYQLPAFFPSGDFVACLAMLSRVPSLSYGDQFRSLAERQWTRSRPRKVMVTGWRENKPNPQIPQRSRVCCWRQEWGPCLDSAWRVVWLRKTCWRFSSVRLLEALPWHLSSSTLDNINSEELPRFDDQMYSWIAEQWIWTTVNLFLE